MNSDNFNQPAPGRQNPETLVGEGFHLLGQGRDEAATRLSHDLIKKYPGNVAVLYFASEIAMVGEDPVAALDRISSVLEKAPDTPDFLLQQGRILLGLRRRRDAAAAAAKAAALSPKNPEMLMAAGLMMSQCEDFAGAEKLFEHARKLVPDNPEILFNLATTRFFLGDSDGAEQSLETLLKMSPENGAAVHLRSILGKSTKDNNHIDQLEKHIAAGLKDWEASMYFNYALAREYEDVGNYDQSFSALKTGAGLRRQHLNYDANSEHASLTDIMQHYTKDVFKDKTGSCEQEGAIFIVGMPRTGTTLIERMLASHSQVMSVGETSDFPIAMTDQIRETLARRPRDDLSTLSASLVMDFEQLGRNYLRSVRQGIGQSRYYVDKLPFNFLYCGLIRKALPKARIIHLVRDPMDSCYAIYKTLFNQTYSFSYDLDELGDYYLLYRALMDHWHRVMPGEIIDVAYEDVVHNPESEARRVLDWCGMPWEAAVLDFHSAGTASSTASAAQVRQPIYSSSVHKWRHYQRQLTPLKNKFIAAGLVTEDGTPF
ncbi:MAG: tetratricopeptide repeat protein [Alphaproteobacteria bacterium]|nr:tetratricopeptide repeat protein [Alphaproteobacteria bacterium]